MESTHQANQNMAKRQGVIVLILTLIMFGIIWKLTSGDEKTEKPKAQKSSLKYVKTVAVENSTLPIKVYSYGRVISERSVSISSEVQGKLLLGSIPLKSGASFKKGELIAKVYDTDAKLSLNARRAQFINLMALSMADIRVDYPDSFQKWNTFFESIDVEKALPSLPEDMSSKEKTFLATKNVLAEYYGIKSDEEKLKKYRITAPFSGSISSVQVEAGSSVNPGSPICTIIQNSALEVQIPVAVNEIKLIGKNSPVHLIHQGDTLDAKMERISSHVNANTQTIDVFASITQEKETIYDGMYFDAEIYGGDQEGVFELSRRALVDENYVYTLKDSGLVRTPIHIIKTNMNDVIIKDLPNGLVIVNEPITLVSSSYKYVAL